MPNAIAQHARVATPLLLVSDDSDGAQSLHAQPGDSIVNIGNEIVGQTRVHHYSSKRYFAFCSDSCHSLVEQLDRFAGGQRLSSDGLDFKTWLGRTVTDQAWFARIVFPKL
jgi:hypothetical protein